MENSSNGNGQKIKLYERVTSLEECHRFLSQEIAEIKTNHLPHIQKAIDNISTKFDRLTWFFVISIVALATNIVLMYAK